MNIGFDFDKIFINYPPFVPTRLIDRLYKKKSNGVLLYRFPNSPEIFLRKITHYPLFRPPITENIHFLKQLTQKKQHKYYLISSRFGFLKNETNHIVKKYGFDKIFDQLYFNFNNKQPHLFKDGVIKKLNIHRYIDDDLPLLHFLATENPRTLFFWLNAKKDELLGKNLFAISHVRNMLEPTHHSRESENQDAESSSA